MVQTIREALNTSDFSWKRRPDPELYVRLLENATSLQRPKDNTLDDTEAISTLETLGKVLNCIEIEIRSGANSEDGGKLGRVEGRELMERCVQAAKDFAKELSLDGRTCVLDMLTLLRLDCD